jgi:putative RecB family exonuclease
MAEVENVFHVEYVGRTKRALAEEPNLDRWLTAGTDGQSDVEARYELGLAQTRAYVEWSQRAQPPIWKGPDGKVGVELHLSADLGGVAVQGYVDQLLTEGPMRARVRDLKTGSTKSPFQLKTYSVLVQKVLGLEVEEADWYMAKTGKPSRPVQVKGVEEEVAEKFATMDQAVKAGKFPAKPGFLCRFCDVSHACDARAGR